MGNEVNKTIYSVLVKYFEERRWDVNAELENLTEKLFYDDVKEMRKTLDNCRLSAFNETAIKEENIKKPNGMRREYINWAIAMHNIYGIPFASFGLNENLNGPSTYAIRPGTESYSVISLDIPKKNVEARKKFIENYRKALERPLADMSDSIFIYDYLEKANYKDQEYLKPYFDLHQTFYETFEKKLENKDFKYIRFLALPIRYKPSESLKEYCQFHSYTVVLAAVLDHCSTTLFRHICNCVFGKKLYNENSVFILVENPPRAYHWALIDERKYILSEYYRYSVPGICKPDILFIDRYSVDNQKLYEIYHEEMDSLLTPNHKYDTHNPGIEIDYFNDAVTSIVRNAEFLLDQAKEKYRNPLSNERSYAQLHRTNTLEKQRIFEEVRNQFQYKINLE